MVCKTRQTHFYIYHCSFTAKINYYKPVLFSQAVLRNYLNSSLVMSFPTWSSKMWLRLSDLGEKDKLNSCSLWLFDAAAWNSFELNRNNRHCCVFLWHNTIHMYFVFQVTDHQIPLDSFSLNLVLLGRENLQPMIKFTLNITLFSNIFRHFINNWYGRNTQIRYFVLVFKQSNNYFFG